MNIAIIGGTGGIGSALVQQLAARSEVAQIYATYHSAAPTNSNANIRWQQVDLLNEADIENWAQNIGELDWLINAAGVLHTPEHGPEKTIKRLDVDHYLHNIRINALPQLLLAKHTYSKFRHQRPGVFAAISARVGSIEENYLGGWYSYRASKAALNMGIKTLAIEWQRVLPNIIVTALHPGTTDTRLSRPFQRNVPPDQLFDPSDTATRMLKVLDGLDRKDSGKFWSFDGTQLPW